MKREKIGTSYRQSSEKSLGCLWLASPTRFVARKLVLGLRTVERRRQEVLKLMGVKTVPQLARLVAIMESDVELV